jgi:TDG/mug DNA glycosylase family protein
MTRILPPLRDRIRPGVRVLFVGINPGVRSALTGHHFAGFSNRFWKLLYESRLVPEPISYEDDDRLPGWGYGITNIVPRPTPGIDTLERQEFVAGRPHPAAEDPAFRPAVVALVGVTVFRALFPERRTRCRWGSSRNGSATRSSSCCRTPSGRNANYSYAEMVAAFRALARFASRNGRYL